MTGTSTVLILPSARPRSEPAFVAMRHAAPGRWLLLGAMVASGGSLRWLRDLLGEPLSTRSRRPRSRSRRARAGSSSSPT